MPTEVQISGSLDHWIDGFDKLERDLGDNGTGLWDGATAAMFGVTQTVVHVVTGRLKGSGVRRGTQRTGDEMYSEIEYLMPYALNEVRRGGEHDYITRAFVATQPGFERALAETWERTAGGWA